MKNKNKEINLLPIYKIGIDEIVDGLVVKTPDYCKCKRNEKCNNHYRNMFNEEEGLYVCPYGFNTFVLKRLEDIDIFTSFRVEERYNKKKADKKIVKNDLNRVIPYYEMENLIEIYNQQMTLYKKNIHLDKFIKDIVHDVRKYNANIKTKSDIIANKSNSAKGQLKTINSSARNIWAMSSFITTRLNIYNYLHAEEPFKFGVRTEYNFYKVFDKIRMCLTEEALKKKNRIKLSCSGTCSDIKAYDSIELLPFLIIDNAIKYTSPNEDIDINISEDFTQQIITIKAIGAEIEKQEINNIFDREYRGKNSTKYCSDGSGIGLYLAKEICLANDITIKVDSIPAKENRKLDEALFKMIICAKKDN